LNGIKENSEEYNLYSCPIFSKKNCSLDVGYNAWAYFLFFTWVFHCGQHLGLWAYHNKAHLTPLKPIINEFYILGKATLFFRLPWSSEG
jgi:hypothetical protein